MDKNKSINIVLGSLIAASGSGAAADVVKLKDLENKGINAEVIADALDYLIHEGVIIKNQNDKLILNQGLLEKLRQEGKIKKSNSPLVESICVVPEPN